LEKLTITDFSAGAVYQELLIPEFALFGRTNIPVSKKETMGFALEDLNFDGFKDIRIYDTANGKHREEWIYLVWNPDKKIFENDSRLKAISLAEFDQTEQLIYATVKNDFYDDHWHYTYKYIDEDLVLVEETSAYTHFDASRNASYRQLRALIPDLYNEGKVHTWLQYVVTKTLNTDSMKMEVTKEAYKVYEPKSGMFWQEYDMDSVIGKRLTEIFCFKPYIK
jgi:hypothetical protein